MKHCEICGSTKGYIYGKNGKYKMDLCRKHMSHMYRYGQILERTKYTPNKFIIDNDILEIVIYNKDKELVKTRVNIKHYELVSQYKWFLSDNGYAMAVINGKNTRLHRLITNAPDNMMVDHRNHDILDNLDNNLRVCTDEQNSQNSIIRSNNTSGYTGVRWSKRDKKWTATITANHKVISLGYYNDIQDAVNARKDGEIKYHGEFAYDSLAMLIVSQNYQSKQGGISND